jgi:MFS family permease
MDQSKRNAIKFVILMGIVSLFGDMVYETARGIMGPYLGSLGASAFAIGLVFGLGEFLGYVLRIVAGVLIDKTRGYWLFVFVGYGLIGAIPLIGLTDSWLVASTFIIMERVGKALRAPAKDTLLSIHTAGIGRGKIFGIHELADQVGAVLGPFLFFLMLSFGLGYKNSLLLLFVPFALMMIIIVVSKLFSEKVPVEKEKEIITDNKKARIYYYLYLIFIFFTSLGFISFPVISYHAVKVGIVSENVVPLIYAAVMVMDALFAIPVGILYDRFKVRIMATLPFLTVLTALAFTKNIVFFFVAILVWGIIMSAYETVIRAFVGDNVPISERGKYYGIFNTVLGISMMIGNSIAGYLYEISILYIIGFVVITQVLGIVMIGVILATYRNNS